MLYFEKTSKLCYKFDIFLKVQYCNRKNWEYNDTNPIKKS